MYKIAVIMLLVSMQAFGWKIDFDPSTYKHTFEILTFESEGDYKRMLSQMSAGSAFNKAVGVVAPLAGKLGGDTVGSLKAEKKPALPGADLLANAANPAEAAEELKYSAVEIALIKASINAASSIIEDVSKSGLLTDFVNRWTKEGYSIDFIKGFKPTKDNHVKCKDEKSLAKHIIHPIKRNKQIFFVIFDKTTNKLIYADFGHAYGSFTFSLKTIKAETGTAEVTVGDLDELDWEGGKSCK